MSLTIDYCARYTDAYFAKQVAELEASGFRFGDISIDTDPEEINEEGDD